MPTYGPESLPYPNTSDAPDGPGAFLSLLQTMSVGGAKPSTTYSSLAGAAGVFVGQLATVTSDGANNGVYSWNGTAWVMVAPQSPVAVRVTRTGAFSTSGTANTYLAIPWDTDVFNVGSVLAHSTTTNPTRFTAPAAGIYRIHGNARLSTTTGSGNAQIAKNGTAMADTTYSNSPAGTNPFVICEDEVQMAAGDYVEFLVASSAASVSVGSAACRFTFIRP